jgi:hypothetical protein
MLTCVCVHVLLLPPLLLLLLRVLLLQAKAHTARWLRA